MMRRDSHLSISAVVMATRWQFPICILHRCDFASRLYNFICFLRRGWIFSSQIDTLMRACRYSHCFISEFFLIYALFRNRVTSPTTFDMRFFGGNNCSLAVKIRLSGFHSQHLLLVLFNLFRTNTFERGLCRIHLNSCSEQRWWTCRIVMRSVYLVFSKFCLFTVLSTQV